MVELLCTRLLSCICYKVEVGYDLTLLSILKFCTTFREKLDVVICVGRRPSIVVTLQINYD